VVVGFFVVLYVTGSLQPEEKQKKPARIILFGGSGKRKVGTFARASVGMFSKFFLQEGFFEVEMGSERKKTSHQQSTNKKGALRTNTGLAGGQ